MSQRRSHSTKPGHDDAEHKPASNANGNHVHDEHDHTHSHSHSLFSHSHSHDDDHNHGAEIVAALQGKGDRGSQITLLGLASNVSLTIIKGVAGWFLHSASLLADAGHSLSDLLGDFVTLFCWKLSRRQPSERYPYGFAKFETLGTTTISLLLVGGALGIGFHSYHLLITALAETASTLPTGPLQEVLNNVTTMAPLPEVISHHHHGHVHSVDPNAAWFALLSVVVKESMFRLTKKVADEERSSVLLANAYHHRSDAYSSVVALCAILGTWWFPSLPLDPIGGLLVSIVILRQGVTFLMGSWADLTDASVSPKTRHSLKRTLDRVVDPSATAPVLAIRNLRARHAGSLIYVDLVADVPSTLTVTETASVEDKICSTLMEARKEVAEVRVKFHPVDA
ncbi:cation efflux protein [Hymenopellis radicata]|nr:cation efflux protein [Hymenopellis radicata]